MPMFYYTGSLSLYLVQHNAKPWIKSSIDTYSVACTEWEALKYLKYCKVYFRFESLTLY